MRTAPTPRALEEPQLVRRMLPGGLLLVAEPVNSVPSLALGVWIRSGSRDEANAQAGIAHFIEHMVFKGTRKYSAYDLAKQMEALGGHFDAFTTKETTCYHTRVFEDHQERAVEILGELLSRSSFAREEVQKERQVIVEEIHSYNDNPEEYSFDLATERIWDGHALGNSILGREDSLRTLGTRTLKEFHRSFYTAPNTIVTAAGRVDVDQLSEQIEKNLHLPATAAPNGKVRLPRFRASAQHLERDVTQTSVCLMRRGPSSRDPKRHAAYVLHTILGAGMSSRLFQKIREDEGLAYTIYSYMDCLRDTGIFSIYMGVDPTESRRAVQLVSRELRRIKRHGIRRWELESAKAQILTAAFVAHESMFERMSRLANNEIYYGRQLPLGRSTAEIESITMADVRAAAESLLDPAAFSLVTIGPAGSSRPGLEDLDF